MEKGGLPMEFVLIDDTLQHNEILADKISKLCAKNGWDGHIALTTSQLADVRAYAESSTLPTVYFMDIELGEKENTLALFESIPQHRENYIIYVSAHAEYAMDCLHTHAFDFLLKPLADEQLADCLSAVMRIHGQKKAKGALQVNTGSQTLLLPPGRILYFSRDGINIHAHCEEETTFTWRESFDHLLTRLDETAFTPCHRSFIVNLHQIQQIDWQKNEIRMKDFSVLPISRRRITALKAALRTLEEEK